MVDLLEEDFLLLQGVPDLVLQLADAVLGRTLKPAAGVGDEPAEGIRTPWRRATLLVLAGATPVFFGALPPQIGVLRAAR